MAKDGTALAEIKHGKKRHDVIELKKVVPATDIKAYRIEQEQMFCSATPSQIRQLNNASSRITVFSSFATFFLGTAITLSVGAIEANFPESPWIRYLLWGFSGFSVALTISAWTYTGFLYRDRKEISDEILETANPNPKSYAAS